MNAAIAPISGTDATNRPASELERRCSALDKRNHGPAISITVYSSRIRHFASNGRSMPRLAASGTSKIAAMPVRANTSVPGVRSRSETLMSR